MFGRCKCVCAFYNIIYAVIVKFWNQIRIIIIFFNHRYHPVKMTIIPNISLAFHVSAANGVRIQISHHFSSVKIQFGFKNNVIQYKDVIKSNNVRFIRMQLCVFLLFWHEFDILDVWREASEFSIFSLWPSTKSIVETLSAVQVNWTMLTWPPTPLILERKGIAIDTVNACSFFTPE